MRAQLLRFAAFATVAAAITLVIAATIHPIGERGTRTFRAVFSSASSLKKGDQVRVAGVVVGRVGEIRVVSDEHGDATAEVVFAVADDLEITTGTRAQIRYLNLVGNRYLTLEQGSGEPLDEGEAIAIDHTQPALDLDLLFNGFKPLFTALDPEQVNGLAEDLVATFQGEGGTVTSLLRHTATLTSTIADRDAVIGRVVDNLNEVLGTTAARDDQLDTLLRQLSRLVSGLAADRDVVGTSITELDRLTSTTAGLLREARVPLAADVEALAGLTRRLDTPAARETFGTALDRLPDKIARLTRVASYGSWFNFYLCDASFQLRLGGLLDGLPGWPELSAPLAPLLDGSALRRISIHDTSLRCRR